MLLAFNILAFAATIAGGLAPAARRALSSRQGMWRIFALRSGILLSVAFTEVLPAAWGNDPARAGWGALAAFALFFFMGSFAMVDSCPEYLEECPVHYLGWLALSALCLHAFIDGSNLAVSFSAGSLAGLGIGVALVLHKAADGFTMTTLFSQAGYSRRAAAWGLALVSAATPLGSLLSSLGMSGLSPAVAAPLLGFAGGSFVYIGAADILPRLHKSGDRTVIAYFSAGMAAMALLHGLGG